MGVRVGVQHDSTERRRRIEVTDEMRRTAFKDAGARTLLLRARAARLVQDSLLVSYEARTYQRISVGMSLRETARERLAFRTESAALVRWHRDAGVRIEVLGARSVAPIAGAAEREVQTEMQDEMPNLPTIPYFPGKEQLWIGGDRVKAEVDESELIHPIAEGSEAYYTFATGDSILMSLPDGKRLTLRELRIAAREPKWNVMVGSFWFETEHGHLVRAIYRFSTQMDIWAVVEADDPNARDDIPVLMRPLLSPMTADVTAISVEYGLHEQRFWLPKLQAIDGYARVSFLRVPIRLEERYRFETVNALDSLPARPPVPTQLTTRELRDSLYALDLDSAEVRSRVRVYLAERDSTRRAVRKQSCEKAGEYTRYRLDDSTLWVGVTVPCDSSRLWNSPDLPPSIYASGEELFGAKEREELVKMLSMDLQPGWAPQPPTIDWGLAFTRYNRVEGFSTGAAAKATLGRGYSAQLTARASAADLQLNGDLTMMRSNGRRELRATAYRRLVVSSDFGDPLTFGASLGGLLYARDEGFYHRAWGAELSGTRPVRGGLDWRLFAEQQWTAPVVSDWSLTRGANDDRFPGNVVADKGWYGGVAARWRGSRGLNPAGWRVAAEVNAEAAAGESDYSRGFVEGTVSKGVGPLAASLTAAAGTSGGTLPAQRQFFLGGLHSVRGQSAGTGIGEAFWLSRVEIGSSFAGARPVVFGDLGWTGARDAWSEVGQPMSGVGAGVSFLDGMIRLDLARGIHPRWQTRLDFYLEARF
ncbi:MAG: hypothetical protein WD771_04840 [Gemmatimonadaceae bacterium]